MDAKEAKELRLKSDWKRIEDSEFIGEFLKIIKAEQKRIYTALIQSTNDRDRDMFLKGELAGCKTIHRKLGELVKSIGENVGEWGIVPTGD